MSSIRLPSRPGRPGRRRADAPTPGHAIANAAQLRAELEDDDEDLFGDDDISELDDDDDLEVDDDDDEVDDDEFGSEGEL